MLATEEEAKCEGAGHEEPSSAYRLTLLVLSGLLPQAKRAGLGGEGWRWS
jgi:hypothetical protein